MAASVRYGLIFGGLGLLATLAIIFVAALNPTCSIGLDTLGPAYALQIGLAAAAGLATSRRDPRRSQSAFAGLGAASVGGLATVILLGLTFSQGWPQACTEQMRGFGVFIAVVASLFGWPLVAAAGAAAGWLASLSLGSTPQSHQVARDASAPLRGKPADKHPSR